MSYGKTPINRKENEIQNHKFMKESFGKDFTSKLKSERRFGFRDFRKEMGQGSASLRRYTKSKALDKAKK